VWYDVLLEIGFSRLIFMEWIRDEMLVKCNVLFSFLGKENIKFYDAKLGLSETVPMSSY